MDHIVEAATSDNKSIVVDKKLIDGPNPNERGKWWIPLVMLGQVSGYFAYYVMFKVLFVGGISHPFKWKKNFLSVLSLLNCVLLMMISDFWPSL